MATRMGILGVGRIGRLHAEHLCQRVAGAEVTAVCDVNPQAAREVADRLRIPRVYGEPEALCRSSEVDAAGKVVVAFSVPCITGTEHWSAAPLV